MDEENNLRRASVMGRLELERENAALRELALFYAREAGYTDRYFAEVAKGKGIRPPKRIRKKKGA